MTAANLLTALYTSAEVDEVMLKIKPEHTRDDVKQTVFLQLYEKAAVNPDFILDLHTRNKLKTYVVKTIYNTAHFSNSTHNRQHRRSTEIPTEAFQDVPEEDNTTEFEELLKAASERLDAIYWYNRDLMRLYVEHGTYQKVSDITKIPKQSVWEAVKQAKKDIKAELNKLL